MVIQRPAPLLGDVGGGAGAAGGVENKVAGVGGHEDAAFQYLGTGLYHVFLVSIEPGSVTPHFCHHLERVIVDEVLPSDLAARLDYASRFC